METFSQEVSGDVNYGLYIFVDEVGSYGDPHEWIPVSESIAVTLNFSEAGDYLIRTEAVLRFVNVPLPAEAAVEEATLSLFAEGGSAIEEEDRNFTIRALYYDSSPPMDDSVLDPPPSLTSSYANVLSKFPSESPSDGNIADYKQEVDVSALVQEIVDRPGWMPGGAISFIVESGVGGDFAVDFLSVIDNLDGVETPTTPHLSIVYSDGADPADGTVSGTYKWQGATAGTSPQQGSTSGNHAWTGAFNGSAPIIPPNAGSTSGSYDWVGDFSGGHEPHGTLAGTYEWQGDFSGFEPPIVPNGVVEGTHEWVGAFTSHVIPAGTPAGTYDWTGDFSGITSPEGTLSGTYSWLGDFSGLTPAILPKEGAFSGGYEWRGALNGTARPSGFATGEYLWAGAFSGAVPYTPTRPDEFTPLSLEVMLDGWWIDLIDVSVTYGTTPARSDDSSGTVGEITFTCTMPFDPNHPLNKFGVKWSRRREFVGYLYGIEVHGRIDDFSNTDDRNIVTFIGSMRTVDLLTFNRSMAPFNGTLEDYLKQFETSLLSVDVDPAIANDNILAPGWQGETWYNFKMFCAAYQLDAILDQTTLRITPFRTGATWADGFHDSGVIYNAQSGTDAQAVEVYSYDGRWVTDSLVYPTGGWNEDVDVLTVNAGETEEYDLEVDGSLISIETPTMTTFVGRSDNSQSQYTIVADDGFPVLPAMWAAKGGSVTVSLNDDHSSINVKITGATNIPRDDGTYAQTFAIALASDTGGSQYSTLRIRGTGILYNKKKLKIATGVPEEQTGTEVGATIDNPFLITPNMAYEAAIATAGAFQGYALSGTVEMVRTAGFDPQQLKTYFVEEGLVFRTRSVTATPGGESHTVELDTRISDIYVPPGTTVGDVVAHNAGLTVMEAMLRGKGKIPNV